MNHPAVASEHATVSMNDLARDGGARNQALDHRAVMSRGQKADVLAVGLLGVRQAEFARQVAHPRLRQASQGKAQTRELEARGGEQEIALVAVGIGGPVQRASAMPVVAAHNIVTGGQKIGAEIVGGVEKVGELHVLIAGDARDRRFAREIGTGERLDHLLAKALLVIEHIMRNAEPGRDIARIVDILPRAACALAVRRFSVVIELHGDANDVVALGGEQRRRDRRIDAARHRDDDAGFASGLIEPQTVPCAVRGRREQWREHGDLLPAKARRTMLISGSRPDPSRP